MIENVAQSTTARMCQVSGHSDLWATLRAGMAGE
jgi:hypothetical protein